MQRYDGSRAAPGQEELIGFLLPASTEAHEYNRDFFSVSPEGGEPTNLTDSPAQYYHPALSPDGSTPGFESNRGGCLNIWMMNARDGSGLVQLTGLAEGERCQLVPRWSPDGSMLAFTATDDLDAGRRSMSSIPIGRGGRTGPGGCGTDTRKLTVGLEPTTC